MKQRRPRPDHGQGPVKEEERGHDSSATIVDQLERHAMAVMDTIRSVMDAVRETYRPTASQFVKGVGNATATSTTTTTANTSTVPSSLPSLHEKLRALPVDALIQTWTALESSNIVERLQACGVAIAQDPFKAQVRLPATTWSEWQPPDETLRESIVIWNQVGSDDATTVARRKIVWNVIWPLLQLLGHVYFYLDLLPAPQREQKSNQKNAPPAPPPGMLSLQNYTDVAAFLEWTVGMSIVPHVDAHVLPSPRSIPKSIQGRLPRAAMAMSSSSTSTSTTTATPDWLRCYELQATAARMAFSVQLDRFRPMLLPRHLLDLWAAVAQAQQILDNDTVTHNKASKIHGQWYTQIWKDLLWPCHEDMHNHNKNSKMDSTMNETNAVMIVDDTLWAATCQRLLQHGRKAPVWLQRQVSHVLQILSYRNLMAVMAVFCPPSDAGAPLRLARTLTTGPRQQVQQKQKQKQSTIMAVLEIFQPLVEQVLVVLDSVVASAKSDTLATSTWTETQQSHIHTVCALLEQFPIVVIEKAILPRVTESIQTKNSDKKLLHQDVRRWTTLLVLLPPFVNVKRINKHLWAAPIGHQNTSGDSGSILRCLWDCVASSPIVVKSAIHEDATYALQLWSQAILAADFGDVRSLDVYTLNILHWMTFAPFYEFSVTHTSSDKSRLDSVVCTEVSTTRADMAAFVACLEQRAKFAVKSLIRPLSQETIAKANVALPSRILQILVVLYLSFGNLPTHLPASMMTPPWELATLSLLPVLCEECSHESLLSEPTNSVPLFKLIGVVLNSVCIQVRPEKSSEYDSLRGMDLTAIDKAFQRVLEMNHLWEGVGTLQEAATSFIGDDQSMLSIATVLLNLLVGLLELGVQNRTPEEESVLSSMVPDLQVLSDTAGHSSIDISVAAVFAELSEMASQANALIAARSAPSKSDDTLNAISNPVMRQFLQAKQDLCSPEAAIRARGVVTLRHLAFVCSDPESELIKPVIVTETGDHSNVDLCDIMAVAVGALSDKESYVFLAAIQTITAGAMQSPIRIVRSLCVALATGVYEPKPENITRLSSEQRIKLSEALVAFVRRRAALSEHLDDILGTLLYATKRNSKSVSTDNSRLIQIQTHQYFTQHEEETNLEQDEKWEETKLRVNTGGPVFAAEEDDVVRGASINLVSEVVGSANPASLVRFVPMMVECAKIALQLESTRPVRRSGALLAASLYRATVREIEEQDPKLLSKQQLECPFTIAMVESGELSLSYALIRVEKGADLSDVDTGRLYDPSTVARCREALATRKEVQETGVLSLAELSVESKRKQPQLLQLVGRSPASKTDGTALISVVKDD